MLSGGASTPSGALDEVSLGKRLQEARRAAGLTQQMLCQRAGLSYSTLAKIERGAIKSPSIFTVRTIALALGQSLDELVGMERAGSGLTPKKVTKSGVKFVYFDVNGCLVRFFQQAFTRLADVSGEQPDIIESVFWHYNDEVCRGTMGLSEFNDTLAKRLRLDAVDWESYYLDAVEPIKEMQALVVWASQQYRVGLLTNIMPGFVTAMREKGLLPDVEFDAVVDSSQIGTIKPEPEIYQIATEKAHVNPEEILLVDDSRANLMAAERLGWHVLWFDDSRPSEAVERVRASLEPAD